MGVVYRAEDLKLHRTVAIKFLPTEPTVQGEARDRFMREARSASGLNHPNICTIYEIDEADGEIFIVMEYIEGQSLRKAIEAGPLPILEVIRLALNIAEGLRAAHMKGIVHRLRPHLVVQGDTTLRPLQPWPARIDGRSERLEQIDPPPWCPKGPRGKPVQSRRGPATVAGQPFP